MGMFDYLKIKVPLEFPDEIKKLKTSDFVWQTKSLDNSLSEYTIDIDGSLKELVIDGTWKAIPEEHRTSPWNVANFEESNRYEKTVDFHGILKFHCFEEYDNEYDFWIDYDAFFIYGKLDKIKLTEYKKQRSTKDYLNNYLSKKQEESKKYKNKIKKIIGWNFTLKKISKIFYNLSIYCSNVQYYIMRNLI